jgi:uncharacterized protein (UPF0548 family)
MITLGRPSDSVIRSFLDRQRTLPFTYAEVGGTDHAPPAGYVVDHTRARLGHGEGAWLAARSALREWRQFDLGWVQAWPADTPLRQGEVVSVGARVCGLHWLNACRIVYSIDEVPRFGFAYGTLPGHVESGEERFLVERDPTDDSVWYDILAFSRPRHLLARIAYPLARRLQHRFARDSAAAMLRAVPQAAAS